MTWQDAILNNAERELSRAEFKLWEFKRTRRTDEQWEAELNKEIQRAEEAYADLLTKVVNATGPLNLFGGTDTWMSHWDGQSNWLECLILNTAPADTVDLLMHLGIMPMREVTDHWDGNHEIRVEKPIDITDVNAHGKIVPISSPGFLSIIKRNNEPKLFSLGRMN